MDSSRPEEDLAAVLKAKSTWLAAARAEGKKIPEPTFRPIIYRAGNHGITHAKLSKK